MKHIVKKILPGFMLPPAQKIRARMTYRKKPRFTAMQYEFSSVLQCCIAYNKYGGYCVPLSSLHRPAAQRILAGDVYEPETVEFLTSHCGKGDVIHAGTFFGDLLPALSRSCSAEAKIWAFEPNPESYRCASITSCINGLVSVELSNAGLGEQPGSAVMITKDSSGLSLGGASQILARQAENPTESKETVEIATVDDTIPPDREVSIIQLDVEGYEQQALSGSLETIRRCLPVIVLESMPEDSWLSENILKLGYRVERRIHNNTVLMPN